MLLVASWDVGELAEVLEISDDILLKHSSYWRNHGVLELSQSQGRFLLTLIEVFDAKKFEEDTDLFEDIATAVSSDAQEEKENKVFETYIIGMLSNFESLTMQRIHNMLTSFTRSTANPCKLSYFVIYEGLHLH